MNCPKFLVPDTRHRPGEVGGYGGKIEIKRQTEIFPELKEGVKLKRTWFRGRRAV